MFAPALRVALLCALPLSLSGPLWAAEADATTRLPDVEGLTGRQLMEAIYARHQQYPFVFESQSMVLVDRAGARETRQMRRFSRLDGDGTVRMLLLFDSPAEVEGVALLASRSEAGDMDVSVYLPALRGALIGSDSDGSTSSFLGTDFTIENITGEVLDDYRYVRRRSRDEAGVPLHVIDVFDPDEPPLVARPLRRHFVRADILFIVHTDHYDELGRIAHRQTFHDLHSVDGPLWRANMVLMEDLRTGHSTLLRIDRRVFSRDYVPAEMFTAEWIVANHPPLDAASGADEPDTELPEDMRAPTPVAPDDDAAPPPAGDAMAMTGGGA
ncbi:MAG TPA: outer membrane lipoprotein-sorting protein [Pseudomonadales bacterium]|nr:outer membrane lipoprotein-sorting protein [Pseudomonadales bacterium]